MRDEKKETASAATETISNTNTTVILPESSETVNTPAAWWYNNSSELRAIRVISNTKAAVIAETVKELYPRHNRQLLSHCEHGEETGVMLRPDALNLLKAKYCPEYIGKPVRLPAERQTPWRSRTRQICCRLSDDKFAALQRLLKRAGVTAQDWMEQRVDAYLRECTETNKTSSKKINEMEK